LAEPAPGTPKADRFDVLTALVEHYEAAHWAIKAPDPGKVIRVRMA
jgi:HTH-type transcriptional regulator/antitoxin HigA